MNILEMKGIRKTFPGVLAVDDVDLFLKKGELLALVGENGAGKSTLIKILSGAYTADSGQIIIEGKAHSQFSTREAIELGIGIVYQELNYLADLSIAENIYLGRLPIKGGARAIHYEQLYSDARQVMERFGLAHRDPRQLVGSLSVAEKQLVEVARAFTRNIKILVMDEPTSALNDVETRILFDLIRSIKSEGVAIIYISHRMNEIFELADSIQVMRDGRNVVRVKADEVSSEKLVEYMVGREISDMYPSRSIKAGRNVFQVRGLTTNYLKNIGLEVNAGEVVGLFGLMGSGRTEIADCIVGAKPYQKAEMRMDGQAYSPTRPLDSLRHGIAYVPAERKSEGINLASSVKDNITLASLKKFSQSGIMNLKTERTIASKWVKKLGIKTPQLSTPAESLSGGNQQKVVVAKGLNTKPRLMILNEPTRGIDVGAKVEIYNLINQLCADGQAVLMISSELPEIMSMADRIYVICDGHVTGEVYKQDFSQERLLKYAIGEM